MSVPVFWHFNFHFDINNKTLVDIFNTQKKSGYNFWQMSQRSNKPSLFGWQQAYDKPQDSDTFNFSNGPIFFIGLR